MNSQGNKEKALNRSTLGIHLFLEHGDCILLTPFEV